MRVWLARYSPSQPKRQPRASNYSPQGTQNPRIVSRQNGPAIPNHTLTLRWPICTSTKSRSKGTSWKGFGSGVDQIVASFSSNSGRAPTTQTGVRISGSALPLTWARKNDSAATSFQDMLSLRLRAGFSCHYWIWWIILLHPNELSRIKGFLRQIWAGFPFPEASLSFSDVAIMSISLGFSWMKSLHPAAICSNGQGHKTKNHLPQKKTTAQCPASQRPHVHFVLHQSCNQHQKDDHLRNVASKPVVLDHHLHHWRSWNQFHFGHSAWDGNGKDPPVQGLRMGGDQLCWESLFFEKQSMRSYVAQAWQVRVRWTIIIAANF